mmetsp:Transcript_90021/g.244146  ORF Transcript_90021/g.244146 Transcript_90021/m.244146 type:complete len:102 (-) Transcript_90021:308-613(-)
MAWCALTWHCRRVGKSITSAWPLAEVASQVKQCRSNRSPQELTNSDPMELAREVQRQFQKHAPGKSREVQRGAPNVYAVLLKRSTKFPQEEDSTYEWRLHE